MCRALIMPRTATKTRQMTKAMTIQPRTSHGLIRTAFYAFPSVLTRNSVVGGW